jgi:WD40 repeat protein
MLAESTAQQAEMRRIAWSPDGNTIAVSQMPPETRVLLWNSASVGSTEPAALVGHTGPVFSSDFSPDGKIVATGGNDREIRLWNLERRETIGKLEAPNGTIRSLRFASDGTLMSAGWFSVDLWDVSKGRRTKSMSIPMASECSTISADGSRAAAGFIDGVVQVWDLAPGEGNLRVTDGQEGRMCSTLSPDGRLLATGDSSGVLRLWDALNGRRLADVPAAKGRIRTIQFSPDGRRLATGSDDDEAMIWDLSTGKRGQTWDSFSSLSSESLAFSPDGHWLAVPRRDFSIVLVPVDGVGDEKRIGPIGSEIISVTFDPSGRKLAVVSRDDAVRLIPCDGGDPEKLAEVGPWVAAISADGEWLAVGGWAREIGLWNLPQHKRVRTLRGHRGLITGLEFMPGQSGVLASAAADGTVRLWDIQTGLALATLDAFEGWEALAVSFSTDGRRLASAGSNAEAAVWNLPYFDRRIAGNSEFQMRALGVAASESDRVRAWVEESRSRADAVKIVTGISPETVEAWGRRAHE